MVISTSHWLPVTAAQLPDDKESCRQRLTLLFESVQNFRHAHHCLPQHLSDLSPDFLRENQSLRCPVTAGAAEKGGGPGADYVYEFEPAPLTNAIARGLGFTLRDLRQWQMGKVGPELPIVRCTNHPAVLNLGFDGHIYETGPDWQEHFASFVDRESLTLEALLSEYVRLQVVRIPARSPDLPADLIDLTAHYNQSLPAGMLQWAANDPPIPARFDVRGIIQLASQQFAMVHYPMAISNVLMGVRCSGLVFLHGTLSGETEGTKVGEYVIRFENGQSEKFEMVYGKQVVDSLAEGTTPRPDAYTAEWIAATRGVTTVGGPLHLYASLWPNPHLKVRILELDFVSGMKQSSPFLAAITAVTEVPEQSGGKRSSP